LILERFWQEFLGFTNCLKTSSIHGSYSLLS